MDTYSWFATGAIAVAAFIQTPNAVGRNITWSDTQSPNAEPWSSSGIGVGGEDQESEPGSRGDQGWDLEALTINGSKLSIYSGFNLLAGRENFALGDIFIGHEGVTKWKTSQLSNSDKQKGGLADNTAFKYDYVVHFTSRTAGSQSLGNGDYVVYKLQHTANEVLDETTIIGAANPWKLSDTAKGLTKISSGSMQITENDNATITLEDGSKVTGGKHYIGGLSLDFLKPGEIDDGSTLYHLTMACGNDTIVGGGAPPKVPDAGSTLTFLAFAMSGMSWFARPRRK